MGTPQSVLHYLDEWPFMLMYTLRLMMFAPHLVCIFCHRCYVTKVIEVIKCRDVDTYDEFTAQNELFILGSDSNSTGSL